MEKSRIELHGLLLSLERSVPALIKAYPDDRDFMPAFVHRADIITDQAAPEDRSWIHGQVGCILDECGKMHDDYLPPSNRQSSPALQRRPLITNPHQRIDHPLP